MTFAQWCTELKQLFVSECGATDQDALQIDVEAYRISYDEGMTPKQALLEDMSYA